jgi:rubrerythrin
LTGKLKKKFICWAFIYGALYLFGCTEAPQEKDLDFLLKTPSMMITSREFSEELDLKRAAYPYNINENPTEYNEMVIHLATMLSEEIVLLSAAADKGVSVTDQEIQSAEDDVKEDYPDDSFDQMLLKNAISYSFWKNRFKKNMIMEKFIDQDLKKKIELTSQDIAAFYQKNLADTQGADKIGLGLKKIEDEQELISRLRTQKTQNHYGEWISTLGKNYPVEINTEKLRTFLIDMEKSKERKNEKKN